MHINFTVFEIRCGHEIARAEKVGYKRENMPSNASPKKSYDTVFTCDFLCSALQEVVLLDTNYCSG